uniref:Uncharacterized protein n=1 Tax=Panagrolaimus sp. ES5 TaxID=591445 RepID=A0AC34F4A1_9BILA
MKDITVRNSNECIIPVEELLRIGKNLKDFFFEIQNNNPDDFYTPQTTQKLAEQIRPKKFKSFVLCKVPSQNFDVNELTTFIRNNAGYQSHVLISLDKNTTDRESWLSFDEILKTNLKDIEYQSLIVCWEY